MSPFIQEAVGLIEKIAGGVKSAIAAVEGVDPGLAQNPIVNLAEAAASLAANDVANFKTAEANYDNGQAALISTISVDGHPGVVVAFRNDSELGKQLGLS